VRLFLHSPNITQGEMLAAFDPRVNLLGVNRVLAVDKPSRKGYILVWFGTKAMISSAVVDGFLC
jgi:hypothetical protein